MVVIVAVVVMVAVVKTHSIDCVALAQQACCLRPLKKSDIPALPKALAEYLAELEQYLSTHGHWPTRHAACLGRKLARRLADARIASFLPLDDQRFKALRDHWCSRTFTPPRMDGPTSSVGVGKGVAPKKPSELSQEVAGEPTSSKRLSLQLRPRPLKVSGPAVAKEHSQPTPWTQKRNRGVSEASARK